MNDDNQSYVQTGERNGSDREDRRDPMVQKPPLLDAFGLVVRGSSPEEEGRSS
jgi:hypothetical protein